MKFKKNLFLFPVVLALLAVSGVAQAGPFSLFATNSFVLEPGEVVDHQFLLFAQDVEIAGTVKDDMFLFSNKRTGPSGEAPVVLSGGFFNDILVVADSVRLTGNVHDHARILARNIFVGGVVSNTSVFIGENVSLNSESVIKGDLLVIADSVEAHGRVKGDLKIRGNKVTLSGFIEGSVDVSGSDIVIMPGTEIMSDLTYRSPKELALDSDVRLHGKLSMKTAPEQPATSFFDFFTWPVFHFAGALLYGVLFIAVLPGVAATGAEKLAGSAWKSVFAGFVVLSLMLTLAFFGFLTAVGMQTGIVLLCMSYVLGYTGKIVCAIAIGNLIFRNSGTTFFSIFPRMFTGLVLLYLLMQAGFAGPLVWVAATLAGTGALLAGIFPRLPWRKDVSG